MNFLKILALSGICMTSFNVFASPDTQTIKSKDLYIDGNLAGQQEDGLKKESVEDEELKILSNEFNNLKNLSKGFEKKNKVLGKMAIEGEKLSELHSEYLDSSVEVEDSLSLFKKQQECLAQKTAKECRDLFNKGSKRNKGKVKRQERDNYRSQNRELPKPIENELAQNFDEEVEMEDITVLRQAAPMPAAQNMGSDADYITLLDEVISLRANDLNLCYQNYAGENGNQQQGLLITVLSIDGAGYLSHLGVENNHFFTDSRVISCVSSVLSTIQYPKPPQGVNVKIRKPFSFQLNG